MSTLPSDDFEHRSLHEFAEKAYLDYAMYVILDRALPHIADGLKPVQRRIVYAMSELGLKAGSKFKKSARTVGDVLGKFHPHGDAACYEAMVLMAQPFSYRYPLIEGQGNWGSLDDPKSFAAMRYTEARLTAFAHLLLSELDQGTVDWTTNFDGTLQEPLLLSARLPHILLNGSTGIAVGMATDIPPHNLREVANACIHLLQHPTATVEELCQFLPAPDYPTEAEIITPPSDLIKIYATGTGSLRLRARYLVEEGEIIITALPYQTSGAKTIAQIAAQMAAKKLSLLEDVRDESDHENPVRLVLVPRSNRLDLDALMAHLFATTELERSYRVNLNVIGIDGRPQVKNLKTLLQEWLDYRLQTLQRRLQYRLEKIEKRLHLLSGLLIAHQMIELVIAVIRDEEKPKPVLMQRLNLSEIQAEAILELRLRQLARLEAQQLLHEQTTLNSERETIQATLTSTPMLKKLLIKEMKTDAKQYGDARRSPLIERTQAQVLTETELAPSEPITLILSTKGWIRAAKGYDIEPQSLNYRAGDNFAGACQGRTHQQAVFLDSSGRSYSTPAHTLPSARGQGEPLTGRFTLPPNTDFLYPLLGEPTDTYLLAGDTGYGFIVQLEELYCKNKTGKSVVTLSDGAKLLQPLKLTAETTHYLVITNVGYLSVIPLEELPHLTKGKGVKLLNFPSKSQERITNLLLLKLPASLTLYAGKYHLTLKEQDVAFYVGERTRRGQKLPRSLQQVERVEVIHPV